MVTHRLLPLLAFAVPVFAACGSAPPSDPPEQSSSSALVVCKPPLCGGTPSVCYEYTPGCTVAPDSNGWDDASNSTMPSDENSVETWISELRFFGCTTPSWYSSGAFHSMWITTCPAGVADLPLPAFATSFSDLVLTCNACVSPAASGHVTLGWYDGNSVPAGCEPGAIFCPGACKEGSCVSAPPS